MTFYIISDIIIIVKKRRIYGCSRVFKSKKGTIFFKESFEKWLNSRITEKLAQLYNIPFKKILIKGENK